MKSVVTVPLPLVVLLREYANNWPSGLISAAKGGLADKTAVSVDENRKGFRRR